MPSKSKAQHNLMEAVAHNPTFAKKVGISTKVGKDFAAADKGKKFAKGGLTTESRKSIPKSEFGLPGERKYPMPDRAHAANAKARASQEVNAGNLSTSAKSKIDAKANKILEKKKTGGKIKKHDIKGW